MIEAGDARIIEAIRHAVVAGSCRTLATKEIQAATGLLRAADRHSGKVAALTDEWLSAGRPGWDSAGVLALPTWTGGAMGNAKRLG
jgi:hypothetical protein